MQQIVGPWSTMESRRKMVAIAVLVLAIAFMLSIWLVIADGDLRIPGAILGGALFAWSAWQRRIYNMWVFVAVALLNVNLVGPDPSGFLFLALLGAGVIAGQLR